MMWHYGDMIDFFQVENALKSNELAKVMCPTFFNEFPGPRVNHVCCGNHDYDYIVFAILISGNLCKTVLELPLNLVPRENKNDPKNLWGL